MTVNFVSKGEPVDVSVRTREGDELVHECRTPCAIDLPPADYVVESAATETAPSASKGLRVSSSTNVVIDPGSSTGEAVGYGIAVPSTVLLPIVTVGTVFYCWPSMGPNPSRWCADGIGAYTILGLTTTTVVGWILAHASHTTIEKAPLRWVPFPSMQPKGAALGWSVSF